MTKEQAMELLRDAPRDSRPSRVNPSLTRLQVVEIVEESIKIKEDGYKLDRLFEKRVYQVCRDQKEPRY